MNFSERLENLLIEKNIKRTALASDIGILNQSISDWKRRNTIPSADIVLKIANYLGVSMEYLITGEDHNSTNAKLFEQLPEEELQKYKIVQINIEDLPLYDEQLMLGNYRLLTEANKNVIKQIMKTLLDNQV